MGNCSIHSHFEFLDTANALPNPDHKNIPDLLRALKAYKSAGYSHVAVTEHGSFSSYEDLRALSKKAGVAVIPAIEGYVWSELFRPEEQEEIQPQELQDDSEDTPQIPKEKDYLYKSSHVILVAKDEIGYRSLTEVINHSKWNTAKQRMEIPIETLRDYVKKGHIICTSACIAGLLGVPLLEEIKRQEDHDKATALLERFDFFSLMKKKEELDTLKQKSKIPFKTKQKNAKKKLELYVGTEDEPEYLEEYQYWLNVEQVALRAKEEIKEREQEFAENEALIKKANKFKCKSKYEEYLQYTPMTQDDRDKNREKLEEILETFDNIFGDDFYIEIQNHQLEQERQIYNTIVSFCEEQRKKGYTPKYIQSNDIHICCKSDDPNIEKMIQARNVMKLVRMKLYDAFDPADSEYCIKTEEEISDRLRELQGTYFDLLTGQEQESLITDEIIEESARNTHILEAIDFAPQKADHYPAVENAEEVFEQKLAEGIKKRFGCTLDELSEEYRERILYEKDIMKKMDVIPYHIIVQDFIVFANYYGRIPHERRAEVEEFIHDTDKIKEFVEKNKFPPALSTGVGRGSAAGSLICYCLEITGLDPIKFNLSMERYLNPERVSMPKQYWASTVNAITQRCGAYC